MGKYLRVKTASEADIALMSREPLLSICFLHHDEDEVVWREILDDQSPEPEGLLARLGAKLGLRAASGQRELPRPPRRGFGDGEAEVDLDAAWDPILWLLSTEIDRGAIAIALLAAGGADLGKVDFGWGPARAVGVAQARALHDALAPISAATLRGRIDGPLMDEDGVAPGNWTSEGEALFDEFVGASFKELKSFLAKAVAAKKGLIFLLT
jgi:hypothetical protein